MDFVSYFKAIYCGKNAARKHILLFSVTGIVALLFNNMSTYFTNNLLSEQLTVGAASPAEFAVDFTFGVLLWLHIFGYEYKFLSGIMNDGELTLPEFDHDVMATFGKMFPLFFLWQIYFFVITFFTGIYTVATKDLVYYFLAGTLMLFFTPFVFMIYIKFSKDFKYTKDVLVPWSIIKYIDKGLVDVVIWSVKFGAYAILPIAFLVGYMEWATQITPQTPRLIAYLAGICVGSYIFTVYKLIYGIGMAKIVKEKILSK